MWRSIESTIIKTQQIELTHSKICFCFCLRCLRRSEHIFFFVIYRCRSVNVSTILTRVRWVFLYLIKFITFPKQVRLTFPLSWSFSFLFSLSFVHSFAGNNFTFRNFFLIAQRAQTHSPSAIELLRIKYYSQFRFHFHMVAAATAVTANEKHNDRMPAFNFCCCRWTIFCWRCCCCRRCRWCRPMRQRPRAD